jgi:hypothetical protein
MGTMKRTRTTALVATSVLSTVLAVGAASTPASALTATTSGSEVTVNMTGTDRGAFVCQSGNVAVFNAQLAQTTVASPTLACSALTEVTVIGDASNNFVDGRGLDAAAFSKGPRMVASLGEGNDTVYETDRNDVIATGSGVDTFYVTLGGVANSAVDLGANPPGVPGDLVVIEGPDTDDTFGVSSPADEAVTLVYTTPTGTTSSRVAGLERIDVFAGGGDDFLTNASDACPLFCRLYGFHGEEGDDTLTVGEENGNLHGGPGTNTFNLGLNRTAANTSSPTDIINQYPTGYGEIVRDITSPRFGGRTLGGFATVNAELSKRAVYDTATTDNDAVVRVRPGTTPGSAVATMTLDRTGQQQLPPGFGRFWPTLGPATTIGRKAIGDVVVPAAEVTFTGAAPGALYDITVPTGSWTENVVSGVRIIDPANDALGDVKVPFGATTKVHGPWTNKNQGFAHRVHRDLLFRFATDATRDQVRDQLASGAKTRTQVAQSLVFSDEYRGLDVDRVFVRFLRRSPDAGGRTYWINSIRNGKSLTQFRAQLFGSNEYFNKAGGTNAAFVERAYQDVLGRKPDPSGLAYWTGKASSGTDRGLIARQFLASSEARRFIVRDQFLRFLDRQPTTGEIDTWVKTLGSSTTGEQDLIVFLAASGSYYDRT